MIQNVSSWSLALSRDTSSRVYARPERRVIESFSIRFHSRTMKALSVMTRSAFNSASRYSGSEGRFLRAGAAGTTSNPPPSMRSAASAALPLKKWTPRICRNFDAEFGLGIGLFRNRCQHLAFNPGVGFLHAVPQADAGLPAEILFDFGVVAITAIDSLRGVQFVASV